MNMCVDSVDVIEVVKSFCAINEGDESSKNLIMAIGAELLDVSVDTINEMMTNKECK